MWYLHRSVGVYCVFDVGPSIANGGASPLSVLIGLALEFLTMLTLVHNVPNPSNHHRPWSVAADVAAAMIHVICFCVSRGKIDHA